MKIRPFLSRSPGPGPSCRGGARPWVLLLILLLGGALVAGLLPRRRLAERVRVDAAELQSVPVLVASPWRATNLPALVLPAEIRPQAESIVYARATGYVKRWLVDLGTVVTNGQLLAVLETPELDQELAGARAQLQQAEAAAALANITARRSVELRRTALVSQQDTDEKEADARLKAAAVQTAQAAVSRLEQLQGFAHIVAPFGGMITSRRLEVGQLVSAGNGVELFRVADLSRLRVFVRVPQTVAPLIQPGQEAEVTLPESPGRHYTARVVRTAGVLDAAARTLLTELELPNPEGRLFAGGFGQLRFTTVRAEPPLVVPANTLLFRPEGPRVAVVKPDNTVELRPLVTGRDYGPQVEVLQGVTPEDRLVLNPADSLAAGTRVTVVKSDR